MRLGGPLSTKQLCLKSGTVSSLLACELHHSITTHAFRCCDQVKRYNIISSLSSIIQTRVLRFIHLMLLLTTALRPFVILCDLPSESSPLTLWAVPYSAPQLSSPELFPRSDFQRYFQRKFQWQRVTEQKIPCALQSPCHVSRNCR